MTRYPLLNRLPTSEAERLAAVADAGEPLTQADIVALGLSPLLANVRLLPVCDLPPAQQALFVEACEYAQR